MTSQNEEAEDLMRRIEKEEEALAYEFPERKVYHLCIVNLVIGTLYCSKGNFDFGINRVIKALEPFQKKLGTDTWFYVKVVFWNRTCLINPWFKSFKISNISFSVVSYRYWNIYRNNLLWWRIEFFSNVLTFWTIVKCTARKSKPGKSIRSGSVY